MPSDPVQAGRKLSAEDLDYALNSLARLEWAQTGIANQVKDVRGHIDALQAERDELVWFLREAIELIRLNDDAYAIEVIEEALARLTDKEGDGA